MKKLLLTFCFFSLIIVSQGQPGFKKGDFVTDFSAENILNFSQSSSSFNNLKGNITIIDFFGTWCAPCIKSLPILARIQAVYPNDVQIVLISIEAEAKLRNFINARKDFSFPVIVDKNSNISNLFQPPTYPYTVVISKTGKLLAVTEAAEISESEIKLWLADKEEKKNDSVVTQKEDMKVKESAKVIVNKTVQLSQDFIYAAKTNDPNLENMVMQLKNLNYNLLSDKLHNDDEKKAFWINIYNGYTQLLLKNNPEKYSTRNKFFKSREIEIAGKQFSLDDIEHGILRRSKIKWSLGYFNKLFPSQLEKQLRVQHIDYRIHFALNCGAKSCPPIAFYEPGDIDAQLSLALKSYLISEIEHDKKRNIVFLPTLMGWFRGDFNGKKGMMKILKKNDIISKDSMPKIKFKKYDWTLTLNNYKN